MIRIHWLLTLTLAITLSACAAAGTDPTDSLITEEPTSEATPIVITAGAITAEVGTVEPITSIPPDQITPTTPLPPPAATPLPTLPSGLNPTELKYRVLAGYPDFFFCDPDYYPVARQDEMVLALERFPEMQANAEEFNTILAHNGLTGLADFTDDQKLLIYREHKKLAALWFELVPEGYRFTLQSAKSEGSGELVTGVIDAQGTITIESTEQGFISCPICLAADTLIDTPTGAIRVQDLRVGMLVWTLTQGGERVAMPLLQVGSTVVPASHEVVHVVLSDGRELYVSPGHPTADERVMGELQAGDDLDGALIVSAERIPYTDYATYDLLPAGETGYYWANGILIASTLAE